MNWLSILEAWPVFLAVVIGVLLFKILPDTWRGPK